MSRYCHIFEKSAYEEALYFTSVISPTVDRKIYKALETFRHSSLRRRLEKFVDTTWRTMAPFEYICCWKKSWKLNFAIKFSVHIPTYAWYTNIHYVLLNAQGHSLAKLTSIFSSPQSQIISQVPPLKLFSNFTFQPPPEQLRGVSYASQNRRLLDLCSGWLLILGDRNIRGFGFLDV